MVKGKSQKLVRYFRDILVLPLVLVFSFGKFGGERGKGERGKG